MNITSKIESVELKFKKILEDFFISVFDDKRITSHGIDHHRRVWEYAKELLTLADSEKRYSESSDFTLKLIIACYLHDIGMSVETGAQHGRYSREICLRFLAINNLPEDDFQDLLIAIEYHDRKDYNSDSGINLLLSILSVADDLDAFGFTGIYRYTEIYLMRGIQPPEIGIMIKANAGSRFENFINEFGFAKILIQKHKKRYLILNSFFSNYNGQVTTYLFNDNIPYGFCGVVEMIANMIDNKTRLEDIFIMTRGNKYDKVIKSYFKGLKRELSMG